MPAPQPQARRPTNPAPEPSPLEQDWLELGSRVARSLHYQHPRNLRLIEAAKAERAAESLAKGSRSWPWVRLTAKRLRGHVQAMVKVTSANEGSEPILIKTQVAPLNARDETIGGGSFWVHHW